MNTRLASFLTAAALTLSPLSAMALEVSSPTQSGGSQPTVQGTPTVDGAALPEGTTIEINGEGTSPEVQAAIEQLKESNPNALAAIQAGLDALGAAGVKPEDAKVIDVFDISAFKDGAQTQLDGSVVIQVATSLTEGTNFVVIHNPTNDTWEYVPAKWLGNGVIELTLSNGLSPFAIVTFGTASSGTTGKPDSGNAGSGTTGKPDSGNAGSGTTGGSTGGSSSSVDTATDSNIGWAMAGVAAGLSGVFFMIKARKNLVE